MEDRLDVNGLFFINTDLMGINEQFSHGEKERGQRLFTDLLISLVELGGVEVGLLSAISFGSLFILLFLLLFLV